MLAECKFYHPNDWSTPPIVSKEEQEQSLEESDWDERPRRAAPQRRVKGASNSNASATAPTTSVAKTAGRPKIPLAWGQK